MNDRTKILAINGSYRDDGITDQAVEAAVQAVQAFGAEVEVVLFMGLIAKEPHPQISQ